MVTNVQATNSVFNITDQNKSFSITTTSDGNSEDGEELIDKEHKILELWSKNDIELHLRESKKRGTWIEIENSAYNLAGFNHFKSEILAELKRVKYRDFEHMVYWMGLTYGEMVNILDVK